MRNHSAASSNSDRGGKPMLARHRAQAESKDDGSAPQLRIDGFSGGRLPPKSSIREIRINQNAYSSQFDQRGNSVLDIFTKPGTDKLHGFVYVQGNADPFNAPNPYIKTTQPGYHSTFFLANLNGPLNKTTSFFLGAQRDDQENNAAVNAVVLDGNNNAFTFSQAVPNPSLTQSKNGSWQYPRRRASLCRP